MIPAGLLRFLGSRLGLGLVGAVALALALWAGVAWHRGKIEAVRAEAIAATDAKWQAAFDTAQRAARDWKAAYSNSQLALAQNRRLTHEQALLAVGADAGRLGLRGPGRATAAGCGSRDAARTGPATSGHTPAGPEPDAPGPGMPAGDGAIVSWGWLVDRAREHDELRAEVLTWRAWDAEQRAAWEAWKAKLPEPEFGPGSEAGR